MCGRMVYGGPDGAKLGWIQKLDHSDLARAWRASAHEIRPTDGVLVARARGRTARAHDGPTRRLDVVRWDFVPRWWARSLRELGDTWNARSETVGALPSFAPAWRCGRRCVVLVSAVVEFPKGGAPRPRGVPAPRVALTRADGDLIALAGIWEAWRRPGVPADAPDAWLVSCALITTAPNGVMAPIYHRMPVVLAAGAIDTWLDPQLPLCEAHALCTPCADDVLRVVPAVPTAPGATA